METRRINAEAFKEEMEDLMEKHNLPRGNLVFVDSFPEDANGLMVSKVYKILKKVEFRKEFPEDAKTALIATLHQFDERQRALLADDRMFIRHTLLHEICHIISRYKDDYACNSWAFYEVRL